MVVKQQQQWNSVAVVLELGERGKEEWEVQ
jgi:hypothetical protein